MTMNQIVGANSKKDKSIFKNAYVTLFGVFKFYRRDKKLIYSQTRRDIVLPYERIYSSLERGFTACFKMYLSIIRWPEIEVFVR